MKFCFFFISLLAIASCQKESLSTQATDESVNTLASNCMGTEIITVDFEPHPFSNVVQTIPYHLEKEPMSEAFVSVKMATHQVPWVIWFYSENVLFAPQALVAFEEYNGTLDRYVSTTQNVCEVHLWDTVQAHEYLYTYEQLIANIEIECD